MLDILMLTAAALGGVPLLAGFGAVANSVFRRNRPLPAGLTVHALCRRSAIDCSWTRVETIDELLGQSHAITWQTVSSYAEQIAVQGAHADTRMLCFDDAHESVYTHALPVLERHGARATLFPIAGINQHHQGAWDVHGSQRHMTHGHIREWVQHGHEVGSHTMTHAALTYLADNHVRSELSDSKKILEDVSGTAVTSLSFPFGCWNAHVWEIARECGYRTATVSRGNGNCSPGLFRVSPTHCFDTVPDLLSRLLYAGPLATARGRIMEQFSLGSPLWRYRPEYRLFTRRRTVLKNRIAGRTCP